MIKVKPNSEDIGAWRPQTKQQDLKIDFKGKTRLTT